MSEMFKRVVHEDWTTIVPIIAFGLMFAVFVVTTIRALRLKKSEREYLATLPLNDSDR
ncbi:hypothetical protein [Haloferula sp. A504]|uniref:hypothetical protein n=1 Tax=Haloferula sp. A504 TaxID=3373601 RepID=UPI0031C13F51|nr:hypothetical protein [Verrucomicrobiaceae bacterium E54]